MTLLYNAYMGRITMQQWKELVAAEVSVRPIHEVEIVNLTYDKLVLRCIISNKEVNCRPCYAYGVLDQTCIHGRHIS